jgi:hypothetical protein
LLLKLGNSKDTLFEELRKFMRTIWTQLAHNINIYLRKRCFKQELLTKVKRFMPNTLCKCYGFRYNCTKSYLSFPVTLEPLEWFWSKVYISSAPPVLWSIQKLRNLAFTNWKSQANRTNEPDCCAMRTFRKLLLHVKLLIALMVEAVSTSEMSVVYQITQLRSP